MRDFNGSMFLTCLLKVTRLNVVLIFNPKHTRAHTHMLLSYPVPLSTRQCNETGMFGHPIVLKVHIITVHLQDTDSGASLCTFYLDIGLASIFSDLIPSVHPRFITI